MKIIEVQEITLREKDLIKFKHWKDFIEMIKLMKIKVVWKCENKYYLVFDEIVYIAEKR